MPVIEVKDINKSFGPVQVLKDINFTVEPGDFWVIRTQRRRKNNPPQGDHRATGT